MTKCIKCDSDHNMVWEDQRTGERTPLQYCKTCFYGLYEYRPITKQIVLKEDDYDENRCKEQMEKLQKYLLQEYVNECALYGWHEKFENIPQSFIDQWDDAYKAWNSHLQTVPIDVHFDIPDVSFESKFRQLAKDLEKSQKEVNSAANHACSCSQDNPSDLPATSAAELPYKSHEDLDF